MKVQTIVSNNTSFKFNISFNEPYKLITSGSNKTIEFVNAINVGKPGSPELPSKIVYVAIPPKGSASASLSNQQYQTYTNVTVEANPNVVKQNDSTLKYENQALKKEYFQSDQYPQSECVIKGYTWIRNYYCAVIQINPVTYNWKLNQVKMILNANLNVTFKSYGTYPVNNAAEGAYSNILKNVIVNYNDAKNFRSFRKLFTQQDITGNWIDYSKEYIKLAIPSDGIYRISYQDLLSYGIDPSMIVPNSIRIFCKGNQLPLYFKLSQPDLFSQGDYIELWAQKNYGSPNYRQIVSQGTDYLNYMNRYTDTTFVWLSWGWQNGRRINIDSSNGLTSTDTINTYLNFQHLEQDVRLWYYDSVIPRVQFPNWQENKVWTWDVLGLNGTISIPFQTTDVVPNSTFKTYVRLISYAADIQTNAHKVGVGINSKTVLDSATFDFKQTANLFSTIPSDLLKSGSNSLKIIDLPTSATLQQILLDWIDIEYDRYTNAINDSLYFQFPTSLTKGIRTIKITNISLPDSDLTLYKVKPDIIKFTNFSISGDTNKTLTFVDTVSGGDAYILISPNYIKSPKFEEKKKFVNLRNKSQGADDILISNKLLAKSAADYQNFINTNYNTRTKLVYVDDIYDEFSYGYPEPEAIRSFLKYANGNWTSPAPSYLTLIGDANYDYKNQWTPVPPIRKKDLVPSYGYPVSDAWYTMWDSNQVDIPQMFAGRIPAENDQQVYFYLDKYSKYLSRPYDSWNKTFLFFSGGDPGTPGQEDELKGVNDNIFNNLVEPKPVGGIGNHFYKTINPPTNFGPYSQTQIQNAIDNGGLFISYVGHSGTQTWDNGITDVGALKNSYDDRFPLISDFGCSTGKFAEPDVDCFGELFLVQSNDGQAISYLSNSSWGYVSTAVDCPPLFYGEFLQDSVTNVAQAHVLAKIKLFQQYGYSDVNEVFAFCNVLFGDPMLNLKLPPKPNLEISSKDIVFLKDNPSDQDQFLPVKIYYHNYGLVPNDSVQIKIKDTFNNKLSSEQSFKLAVPLFTDSLVVNVPIKGEVGTHNLTVTIDSANTFDEIYETDNQTSTNFTVYSITFRSLSADRYYNPFNGKINLLNPSYSTGTSDNKLIFQVDTSENFNSPVQYASNLDTFSTSISLSNLIPSTRYWWRVKLSNLPAGQAGSTSWSVPYSFTNISSNYNWYINSPADSLSDIKYVNANYNKINKAWELTTARDELKISSAGSSDGKFASMQYNLLEQLPTTYYWGISIALIDTVTLQPHGIQVFSSGDGSAQTRNKLADSLTNYINSLAPGTVLAMTVCDDGAQSVLGYNPPSTVRDAIKELGSIYIDSVKYRESWCILGKKGAAPGTVPEVYKKQFQGNAVIDTSKIVKSDSGSITFPEISNSVQWDSLLINSSIPTGASINVIPIGIKSSNEIDTLTSLSLSGGHSSLKGISAKSYPAMKILLKLHANQSKISPKINDLGVKFKSTPELGTNYQVVSIGSDSIQAGANESLQFYVYNVGSTPADSFNVKVDVVNSDNSHNTIFQSIVDSLNPNSRRMFNVSYNSSSGSGAKSFYIDIDPDNKVSELYKDNNIYSVPFYVKPDTSRPSLQVEFDGRSIMDGDYVSSNPKIKVELNDPSLLPISDTSAVSIFLNDEPVYYAANMSPLSYKFSSSNPKFEATYTPTLKDGVYILKVIAKNPLSSLTDTTSYIKSFTVSNEPKLLYVYNYPDPFKSDTYFTFKLTQVPDKLEIRIFTIAGRLIRDIKVNGSGLKTDFNSIHWDGRDQNGDLLANGVYLYKINMSLNGKTSSVIQKLAIVR
jgi:hypothetical protein